MFGAKYNRLTFWIWSGILLVIFSVLNAFLKAMESQGNTEDGLNVVLMLLVVDAMWLNALANRIRDYGSNPWRSLLALIPLVNIGLALYYGIAKVKKEEVE